MTGSESKSASADDRARWADLARRQSGWVRFHEHLLDDSNLSPDERESTEAGLNDAKAIRDHYVALAAGIASVPLWQRLRRGQAVQNGQILTKP